MSYENLRELQIKRRQHIDEIKQSEKAEQKAICHTEDAEDLSQQDLESRIQGVKKIGLEYGNTNGLTTREDISEEVIFLLASKSLIMKALSTQLQLRLKENRAHKFSRDFKV